MNALYWIEIFGRLSIFTGFFVIIGIISSLCFGIYYAVDVKIKEEMDGDGMIKRWIKVCIVPTLILTATWLFIPSRRTAMEIYGIGSTIDYIKNDTKEIPDNALKALDLYLEEYQCNH